MVARFDHHPFGHPGAFSESCREPYPNFARTATGRPSQASRAASRYANRFRHSRVDGRHRPEARERKIPGISPRRLALEQLIKKWQKVAVLRRGKSPFSPAWGRGFSTQVIDICSVYVGRLFRPESRRKWRGAVFGSGFCGSPRSGGPEASAWRPSARANASPCAEPCPPPIANPPKRRVVRTVWSQGSGASSNVPCRRMTQRSVAPSRVAPFFSPRTSLGVLSFAFFWTARCQQRKRSREFAPSTYITIYADFRNSSMHLS